MNVVLVVVVVLLLGTGIGGEGRGASVEEEEGPVNVVMCADGKRWQHAITTINSVLLNTQAPVRLFALTDGDSTLRVDILLKRMFPRLPILVRSLPKREENKLRTRIKIRGNRESLANPMNYARYFVPEVFPEIVERFIYLDDDVIVQGDIVELWHLDLEGHDIAVSSDCSTIAKQYNLFQNSYDMFINFDNPHIQDLGMDPKTCSFNAGVFVADARGWREHSVPQQLFTWLERNAHENVYGGQGAGGGSQPPMLIVFYKDYAELPAEWHIRGLGSKTGANLPRDLVKGAKLLHWTGRDKPWLTTANPLFVDLFTAYAMVPA